MRLSEAIRLGAMAVGPVNGPIFGFGPDHRICTACAIGAPIYALLGEAARQRVTCCEEARAVFGEHWPWTLHRRRSPAFPGGFVDVVSSMIGLFENMRWTREEIADWVEQIEAQQDPAATVEPAQSVDAVVTGSL